MPHCPHCTMRVSPGDTRCETCGGKFPSPSYDLFESRLTASQESAIPLFKPLALLLCLIPVLGGILGIAGIVTSVLQLQERKPPASALTVYVVAGMLYVFGIYCGLRLMLKAKGWLRANFVFWSLQIPALSSPILSYSFSSGAFATGGVQLFPNVGVFGHAWIASNFSLSLFTSKQVYVGINVPALAITYYLFRLYRTHA